ncbi:unnamed protein product [Gulo gulo]|uniref:Uncharacterized protein n=1 Tax=Gulo gulo TaxID=48420 RepID=A0A9X9LH17_GULGU|nr:unnamed protein product [Gulo gulo]
MVATGGGRGPGFPWGPRGAWRLGETGSLEEVAESRAGNPPRRRTAGRERATRESRGEVSPVRSVGDSQVCVSISLPRPRPAYGYVLVVPHSGNPAPQSSFLPTAFPSWVALSVGSTPIRGGIQTGNLVVILLFAEFRDSLAAS